VTFEAFDVVRVPFPFTDRETSKRRPALVLSCGQSFNAPIGHAVMAMITSSREQNWPLDHDILDLQAAGLPVASRIRFKLFTLDLRLVLGKLGQLSSHDAAVVSHHLQQLLPLR